MKELSLSAWVLWHNRYATAEAKFTEKKKHTTVKVFGFWGVGKSVRFLVVNENDKKKKIKKNPRRNVMDHPLAPTWTREARP